MIISERQIMQLIQCTQLYLKVIKDLSECGKHNQIHVARLLKTIDEQQSDKLIEIKDDNH